METVGQRQFDPRRPAASEVLSVTDVRGVPHPQGGWPVAWAIEGLFDTAYVIWRYIVAISRNQLSATSGSLFSLLHPRGQARLCAGALVVGLLAGWFSVTQLSLPL
jgi:hypothetical protein